MKSTRLYVEITLMETLDGRWAAWFEGLQLSALEGSRTLLRGELSDQAELHGTIERIRDLNLKLISVIVEEK